MAHRRHPLFARFYPRLAASMEAAGMAEVRQELLAGLSGRVIEVGCGDGANFGHFPDQVSAVVAVEPEPRMRMLAQERAERSGIDISIADGTAEDLPGSTAEFDAAVTTLVLCSVDDQRRALAQIARVLKPGGKLYCFEHVGSPKRNVRRAQRIFDAVCWSHVFGGCHTARDTAAVIAASGFDIGGLDQRIRPDLPAPFSRSTTLMGTAIRQSAADPGNGR